MNLSELDKELILTIDSQVKHLQERCAAEHVIVTTLMNFIPDIKCIINSTCEKQLDLYCAEYQYFRYFLQLVNQKKIQ